MKKIILISVLCSLTSIFSGCVGNRASVVEIPAKQESRLPETITAAGNVMGVAWDRLFGK